MQSFSIFIAICVLRGFNPIAGRDFGTRRKFPKIFRTADPKAIASILVPKASNHTSTETLTSSSAVEEPIISDYTNPISALTALYDSSRMSAENISHIKNAAAIVRNILSLGPLGANTLTTPKIEFAANDTSIAQALHRGSPPRWVYESRRVVRRGAHGLSNAVVSRWNAFNQSSINSSRLLNRISLRKILTSQRLVGKIRYFLSNSLRYAENVLDSATVSVEDLPVPGELDEEMVPSDASSADVTSILEIIVPYALSLIEVDSTKWQLLSEKSGIKVLKGIHPELPSGQPSKWPCYRASTLVSGSPDDIGSLLFDSSKVHLINRYSAGRTDVEIIDASTKIVHNRILDIIGVRKPHDFCSLLHLKKLPDGTVLLFSVAVNHTAAPVTEAYVRSKILFGLNVMRPIENTNSSVGSDNITEMTSISHVQYANLKSLFSEERAVLLQSHHHEQYVKSFSIENISST